MKHIFLIIGLFITISFTVLAQPPSWENEITLSTAITGAISAASDGYGQHLVGIYSGTVKHFLIGNDGGIIYNTLSVTGGEYPTVTSYGGKVRVTMKISSNIYIYQSTNGGSTWSTLPYYSPGVPIYSLDSYSDEKGTNIVWEDNSDQNKNHEIYYVRYDDRVSGWQDFKNVTDLSSPATGGRPSVTTTSNKAHVGFAGANYRFTTRDLNLTTHVWDANYKTETTGPIPIRRTNLSSIGDSVYAVSLSDIIVGWPCTKLYLFTARHANDNEWRDNQQMDCAYLYDVAGPRYLAANQGLIWFVYLLADQDWYYLYTSKYTPGIPNPWSVPELIYSNSVNNTPPLISASQTGIYFFWERTEVNWITYKHMRRKPLTVTSGFSQNTFLTGNNWLSGNLTIPSEKTLEAKSGSYAHLLANSTLNYLGTFNLNSGSTYKMYEGTTMNMGYQKTLTANGIFIAEGTSSSPINITSTNQYKGSWERINLYSGPNTIKYCNIKWANWGIYINNSTNNTIENCGFDNGVNAGVYAISSYRVKGACTIKNSSFTNMSTRGIGIINGRADISNIYAQGNSQGLTAMNSVVYLDHSRVQYNTSRGIYISGSTASIYLCADDFSPAVNKFLSNAYGEVYITSSGWAYIGNYDAVKGIQYGGSNCITNSGGTLGKLVYHAGRDIVPARKNYWGSDTTNGFYGQVDHSYVLTSSPCLTLDYGEGSGEIPKEEDIKILIKELAQSVEDNEEDATSALRQLAGLIGTGSTYAGTLDITWEQFLYKIINSSNSDTKLRSIATAYYIQTFMEKNQYSEVISMCNSLLEEKPDEDLWFYCKSAILFANVYLNKIDEAYSVLASIEENNHNIDPKDIDILKEFVDAANISNSDESSGLNKTQRSDRTSIESGAPDRFILQQNYPNPFNPTTRFDYAIPTDEYVTLKIYDVLGREVATVVDELQIAGYKSIEFDASGLPSGMYFYRLQAGRFTDVKKMLLVR